MKIWKWGFLMGLMIGFSCVIAQAADTEKSLAAEAKIDKQRAQEIALTKAPGGAVQSGELEREHGHLVWSFDISNPKSHDITEVQVDAITGKIVHVASENPVQQAAEAQADKAKK
jgi:uncharacterized membrane protein YkoI